ncbi:unnamed protein product, partial [Prorocentrum cordatum]
EDMPDLTRASQSRHVGVAGPEGWLHGNSERYHVGSVVYIHGVPDSYDIFDEPCVVQGYDAQRGMFTVRMLHPRFKGQLGRVSDEHLRFGYCVLPSSITAADGFERTVRCVDSQDERGRGLEVRLPIREGDVVFEEAPFLLAADDTSEMCRAHFFMMGNARRRQHHAAGHGGVRGPRRGRRAPGGGARAGGGGRRGDLQGLEGAMSDPECLQRIALDPGYSTRQVASITSTLLRWETNRHYLRAGPNAAYGLFRWLARVNHSCQPSVEARCQWSPLSPGSLVQGDGRCVVRALRDLAPGEALSDNYATPELLTKGVSERREHLLQHHGFLCRCPRCVEESCEGGGAS